MKTLLSAFLLFTVACATVPTARELPRDPPDPVPFGFASSMARKASGALRRPQPVQADNNGLGPISGTSGTFTDTVTAANGVFTSLSSGASGFTSSGTNTLSGATPLNLTGATSGMWCHNAAVGICYLESGISAANAGATPASAAVKIFTDSVLDATDYVFSVGTQANGTSVFNVAYNGSVALSGALAVNGGAVSSSGGFSTSSGNGYFGSANPMLYQTSASNGVVAVEGNLNDAAAAAGVKIGNGVSLTSGTDRYIASFYSDNITTVKAKVDSSGGYQAIMGTSSGFAVGIGIANTNSTAVGNVGASGPDDLITYTLPASALTTTNRGVRITAWGTCANNANAKTFTLNYGGQVILTHACTISVASTWKIESIVIRTGASTQDWSSVYTGNSGAAGAFEYDPELGTASQTETNAQVIKMQTTVSTSNNDIVQEGMIVEYL